MKIIISKDKNGKQITKYKPEDGLIFTNGQRKDSIPLGWNMKLS